MGEAPGRAPRTGRGASGRRCCRAPSTMPLEQRAGAGEGAAGGVDGGEGGGGQVGGCCGRSQPRPWGRGALTGAAGCCTGTWRRGVGSSDRGEGALRDHREGTGRWGLLGWTHRLRDHRLVLQEQQSIVFRRA